MISKKKHLCIAIVALLLLVARCLTLSAQPYPEATWGTQSFGWVAQRGGDSCNDVWFCCDYAMDEPIGNAHIDVLTMGWTEVFVNGRNIDRSVLTPIATDSASAIVRLSYDITRFLIQGLNTVAINYAPRQSHCSGCEACRTDRFDASLDEDDNCDNPFDTANNERVGMLQGRSNMKNSEKESTSLPQGQISVRLYGTNDIGDDFEYFSGAGWLCHTGNRRLTKDGGELIDGRAAVYRKGFHDSNIDEWASSIETAMPAAPMQQDAAQEASGYMIDQIYRPRYEGYRGGHYTYRVEQPMLGFIRITLRDCRRGSHIKAKGMRYICSGEIDEQAYPKFTLQPIDTFSVVGDADFTRDNIYTIEALSLQTSR